MSETTAIQGYPGSFHEQAAKLLLGPAIELIPCDTFSRVFDAVARGNAAYGVSAVENSLYGSINPVYGLLRKHNLWIAGEIFLGIKQCLIVAPAHVQSGLETIERVLSQAPALDQCENWLAAHLPQAKIEETRDTAASVKYIMEHSDEPWAAIAGEQAAGLYGARILASPINDDPHNYTRFFLLTKEPLLPADANKTSIIIETKHEPAALYQALNSFATRKVNLSKLASHPIPGDTWHYAFYIDFDLGLQTEEAQAVIRELKQPGRSVKILGSYRAAALPNGIQLNARINRHNALPVKLELFE